MGRLRNQLRICDCMALYHNTVLISSHAHHKSPTTGKVHGSLARAGKVRGQTPKVEKQEKKKQPTGRAKKRLVYTRRFLNVGMLFGVV